MRILSIFFLAAICLLSACNEKQIAVNKLQGNWTVKSVEALQEGSFEIPQSGSFYFEACDADRKRHTECDGYYSLGSEAEQFFLYSVDVDGTQFSIVHLDDIPAMEYQVFGPPSFEVKDDQLTIEASLRHKSVPIDQGVKVKIICTKASEK
jgi:hypothetical protein